MFGFKAWKRRKTLQALESQIMQENYQSIIDFNRAINQQFEEMNDKFEALEGKFDRVKMELSWHEEKLKIGLNMIAVLEEVSDYDVETISSHCFAPSKKERKEELIKAGYTYFACIDGNEAWKKRKV